MLSKVAALLWISCFRRWSAIYNYCRIFPIYFSTLFISYMIFFCSVLALLTSLFIDHVAYSIFFSTFLSLYEKFLSLFFKISSLFLLWMAILVSKVWSGYKLVFLPAYKDYRLFFMRSVSSSSIFSNSSTYLDNWSLFPWYSGIPYSFYIFSICFRSSFKLCSDSRLIWILVSAFFLAWLTPSSIWHSLIIMASKLSCTSFSWAVI